MQQEPPPPGVDRPFWTPSQLETMRQIEQHGAPLQPNGSIDLSRLPLGNTTLGAGAPSPFSPDHLTGRDGFNFMTPPRSDETQGDPRMPPPPPRPRPATTFQHASGRAPGGGRLRADQRQSFEQDPALNGTLPQDARREYRPMIPPALPYGSYLHPQSARP